MAIIYPSPQAPLIGVIYCVTCQKTKQQYIGQTKYSMERRWRNHLQLASRNPKYYFHRAIAKYGADQFTIELVEEVPWERLDEREQYWIATKKTQYPDGYNSTPGGSTVITPLIDLTGHRFGQWVVLGRAVPITAKHSRTYWRCVCDCGAEHIVQGLTLTTGRSEKCRACNKSAPVDMTGQVIGDWTIIKQAPGHSKQYWICRCRCGQESVLAGGYLRHKNPISCRSCADKRKIGLRLQDLIGQVFGDWTVETRDTAREGSYWWCRCSCGKRKSVWAMNLKKGKSTQCRSCARKKSRKGPKPLPANTSANRTNSRCTIVVEADLSIINLCD